MHSATLKCLAGLLILVGTQQTQTCQSQTSPPEEVSPPAYSAHLPSSADSTFARLMAELSEPGGYFDTDNLISNETSYLHVMGKMRDMEVQGGAYIGVGPDQNFSYIAQIRPAVAYIIDIRRDNALQHLWFKALFELSGNRIEFLCNLFARPLPDEPSSWSERSLEDLAAYIDMTPTSSEQTASVRDAVHTRLTGFGVPLSDQDLETIDYIHQRFIQAGLSLKFTSHNRSPRYTYPTYRTLMLERDLTGRQANYLGREEDFQFLKMMQVKNLIIPVVGNLAGEHALRAVATDIKRRGESVSAFYTSNVEFYLMGNRSFNRFADNVMQLPTNERSVMIRSYFRGYDHPQAVAGYHSTQLLQPLNSFRQKHEDTGYRGYWDLVYHEALDLR